MSLFKKRRFSEVEGYGKVSRMLEDRQRELMGDEHEDDTDDEETVVLAPRGRAGSSTVETVSLTKLAGPPVTNSGEDQERQPATEPISVPAIPATPRLSPPPISAPAGNVSLVARDAVWEGKLTCTGDVRVEGTVQGEIETTGTLHVAADAHVRATVRARNVMLAGELEGQLQCSERLEILPGGSARGEISTGALVVHEGAFIESTFQMRREVAATHA